MKKIEKEDEKMGEMDVMKGAFKNECAEWLKDVAVPLIIEAMRLLGTYNEGEKPELEANILKELAYEADMMRERGIDCRLNENREKMPLYRYAKLLKEALAKGEGHLKKGVVAAIDGIVQRDYKMSVSAARRVRQNWFLKRDRSARKRMEAKEEKPALEPLKEQVIEVRQGLDSLAIEIKTPTGLALSLLISFSK